MSREPTRRMYYTIDGLRGLAALLVVLRHIIPLHGDQLNAASSYLAVELFFLFSGFVIAHAYDRRFEQGLGFWEFVKVRLVRLYPLYFLAFAIAVLTVPVARMFGLRTWSLDPWVIIPGLFMLPTFARSAGGNVYPYNNPSWTLFFELTANFSYALVFRRLNNRVLAVILMVAAVGLAATAIRWGSLDVGFTNKHFIGGFGRVFFSFFAGVAVYRFHLTNPCAFKLSPWILMAGAFVLLVAWPHRGPDRTCYDIVCALLIFPLFAYLATATEPGPVGQTLFKLGGGASYALYLIHSPLGGVLNQFFVVFGRPRGNWIIGLTFLACVSVIAWLVEKYYDGPVRRWLNGLLGLSHASKPPAPKAPHSPDAPAPAEAEPQPAAAH